MINRLTFFHGLTLTIVIYLAYFHDAISLLWRLEQTKVSFVIVAIYVACSVYLAIKRDSANFKAVNFQRSELTAIGLLGTIIGLGMLGASAGGDISAFKAGVIDHLATIFIPSAFGIGFSLLLGQQLSFVFGENE